ncbi:ribonuclease P [Methanoculleus sediminis]|uniref:Ribonuclease P protein component 4 n=1 Tax=Methanoculleus sediminis TaxID=1550566 RepID=A0A0H1QZM4_9EURY|nr:ribonuclease P [Methanoculleus sediminis]KLK88264.1 ribonuclease P [Methanoculleus sediminis]
MADTTRKSGSRRLARERIAVLFARAAEFYPESPDRSNRCVELARKIGMRHRIRIERPLKRRFCRRCYAYLVPGSNARVRVHRGRVVVTCLACGHRSRFPVGRPRQ